VMVYCEEDVFSWGTPNSCRVQKCEKAEVCKNVSRAFDIGLSRDFDRDESIRVRRHFDIDLSSQEPL
jgi:hypothetical protein